MAEMKALQSENESLKSKAAKEALGDVMDQVEEVKGTKLFSSPCRRCGYERLKRSRRPVKGKAG